MSSKCVTVVVKSVSQMVIYTKVHNHIVKVWQCTFGGIKSTIKAFIVWSHHKKNIDGWNNGWFCENEAVNIWWNRVCHQNHLCVIRIMANMIPFYGGDEIKSFGGYLKTNILLDKNFNLKMVWNLTLPEGIIILIANIKILKSCEVA